MQYAYIHEYQSFEKCKKKYLDWLERLFGKERCAEILLPMDSKKKGSKYRSDRKWLKELHLGNIQECFKILSNKKYGVIHNKYSGISRSLIKVVYPQFLDEYLGWKKGTLRVWDKALI
jgi:hypothetical protein